MVNTLKTVYNNLADYIVIPTEKMSYNKFNRATEKDRTYKNIKFDSRAEMFRYIDLELLVRTKKISKLKRQVKFILLPSFTINKNKKYSGITYIADFTYFENKIKIIEDYKGYITPLYKLKKKLLLSNLKKDKKRYIFRESKADEIIDYIINL